VKGGNGADSYVYEVAASGDTDLHAPVNEQNGQPAAISHVLFCWNTDAPPPPKGEIAALKFYDANANGINDDGQPIAGWSIEISGVSGSPFYTDANGLVTKQVADGQYTVSEGTPLEANWMHTTPPSVDVTVAGDKRSVEFGNLCLGAGGGLTLGFWSNKNGQALFDSSDLAAMVALNLRTANGSHFDPQSYAAFRGWLLNATATNMSYMLSAQLAAMKLNVANGKVDGNALIYAPGTDSASALGFAAVNALIAEANQELGAHGSTPDGSHQEALKNALDRANNNLNFVQPSPCPFTFAP
jgi:hypothetical protein